MAAIPSTPPWPWSITDKNMQKTEPALIEPAPLMFLGILYLPRRGIVGAWACPDAPSSIRRNRRGERLPLEGKLAQLSLRLMRSKRSFITMSRYKIATFDLIRHAFGVTPSPQGEGFGLCKPATPTAPHPSRAKARATFPQGKAFLRNLDF